MKAATLKALKGSIRKWELIVAGTVVDEGGANCPLCVEFAHTRGGHKFCSGCPVFAYTGKPGCVDSPWELWATADKPRPGSILGINRKPIKKLVSLAQDELDFLKSLLPSAKQKTVK